MATKCRLFTNEQEGFAPFYRTVANESGQHLLQNMAQKYARYDSEEMFYRMIVLDCVVVNEDRHMGNHGFLIDNASQQLLRMGPVFDLNVTLFPYVEKEDFENLDSYIKDKGPRIGGDFVRPAQAVLTPAIRRVLINLKDFRFEQHPKYPWPEWRLDAVNRLLGSQIRKVLEEPVFYIEKQKTPAPGKTQEQNPLFDFELEHE